MVSKTLQEFNYSRIRQHIRKLCHTIEKEKCSLQHAEIVETNVKCHSNLKKTDQSIAENVSKITNHKETHPDSTEVQEMIDQEKCSLQHAEIVETNVKCHSNLKKTDQSIAENVSKITDRKIKVDCVDKNNNTKLQRIIYLE